MMATENTSNQPPVQNGDGLWIERYDTASKIYHYPMVTSAVEYGKGWYNYAKDKSTILKYGFETAESTVGYVSKPIQNTIEKFDGVIIPIDKYSVEKLEQVEQTIETVRVDYIDPMVNKSYEIAKNSKDTIVAKAVVPVEKKVSDSITVLDTTLDSYIGKGSQMIQGTKLDELVLATNNLVEGIIDNILPPPENEDLEKLSENDLYALEKRAKFLLKLRKRINLASLQHIPSNSYSSLVKLTKTIGNNEITQLKGVSQQLAQLSQKIQSISITSKANEATQALMDNIYKSLDTLTGAISRFLIYTKRVDPTETLVSIQELIKMIKDSKDEVFKTAENNERVIKFKSDCSNIINRIGEVLQEQIDATYSKLDQLKKADSIVISQTVEMIQEVINKIHSYLPNSKPHSIPITSSDENTSSSSTSQ